MKSSTSPSDPGGRRGPSLAVIDTPGAPSDWEDARAELVRIVDPLGRAVAWLAPAHRGRCVGFAVRPSGERGTAWVQLFPAASPRESSAAGCGVHCALLSDDARGATALGRRWRFVERDPTAATLAASLEADAPAYARDHVGGLQLHFSAALNQGRLALDIVALNRAAHDLRLRLGLDLALLGVPLRDAAGSIPVELPGSPLRQDMADTRLDIAPHAVAKLGAPTTPVGVEVELVAGVSRLRYRAPGAADVVSLVACAGDEPGGMVTVEAGGTIHMAVALGVTWLTQGNAD